MVGLAGCMTIIRSALLEPCCEKTCLQGFRPGQTQTELSLIHSLTVQEISDLRSRGLYYFGSEHKGADQLCSYCAADLRLCF